VLEESYEQGNDGRRKDAQHGAIIEEVGAKVLS
jgi:hypothetical protein